jgi:hypothetical protein
VKPDDIYAICTAYEQGYWHGFSVRGLPNPYCIHTDEREAWNYGYNEGKRKAKFKAKAPPQSIKFPIKFPNKLDQSLIISTSERRARRSAEQLKAITAKAIEEPVKWAKDRPPLVIIDDPETRFDRTLAKRLPVKSCSTCRFVEKPSSASSCMSCEEGYTNHEAKP